MHILPRGLMIALMLVVAQAKAADINDITAYVLRVRRAFPDFIRAADRHNINLVHLAKMRLELGAALGRPEARRAYQTITLRRSVDRTTSRLVVEPQSLDDLRRSFRLILKSFGERPTDVRPLLLDHVLKLTSSLAKIDHGPEEREHNASLRGALIGSLRFALWSQTFTDLAARAEAFDPRDLEVFNASEEFERRWNILLAELGISRRGQPELFRILRNIKDHVGRRALRAARHTTVVTRKTVRLHELPPDLALAKGFWAGDCSSRECFGYPYSVHDRVFAVVDEEGEPRGVVSITRVTEGDRVGFYVNTINGRRIDGDVTMMILRGLHALLGPEPTLLLPVRRQIDANFNFETVRETLFPLIANSEPRPIQFLDRWARHRIEQFSLRSYDAMDVNQWAHRIDPNAITDPHVEVEVTAGSPFESFDRIEVRAEDLPRAMVEAVGSGRRDVARGLWTAAGHSDREAEQITDDLSNMRGETTAAFEAGARRQLLRMGLDAHAADHMLADPIVFERSRLVARDGLSDARRAGTFLAMIRHLSKSRNSAEHAVPPAPEIRAWFKRLKPAHAEELLQTLLNLQEKSLNDKRGAYDDIFADLITLPKLNERAFELSLKGYSWQNIIEVARALTQASPVDPGGRHFERASRDLLTIALNTAVTSTAYANLLVEFYGKRRLPARTMITALGRSLTHLTLLRPTSQQLIRLGLPISSVSLLLKLRDWVAAGPLPSAEMFLESIEALGQPKGENRETLLQAAVTERLPEFFELSPTADQMGRLRRLALRHDSDEDRTFLSRALAEYVRHPGDLLALTRGDGGPQFDRTLAVAALMNLDRVTALYRMLPDEDQTRLASGGRLAVIWKLVRRDLRLRASVRPDDFLARLREVDVGFPKDAPHGLLTAGQIDYFVSLRPTIAEFRALMITAGEVEGYPVRAVSLIKTLDDLTRMVEPIEIEGVLLKVIRREFNALTALVATRPDAGRVLSESALDELSARAGLDILRQGLPPITKACEARLGGFDVDAP